MRGKLKSLLPESVKRPLRYTRSAAQAISPYMRGRRILREYTRHHQTAQSVYKDEGNSAKPAVKALGHFGNKTVLVGAKDNFISLADNYEATVAVVAHAAASRLDRSEHCSYFPSIPSGLLPERTDDIPAIRNGDVITVKIKNPLEVDGLEDLCAPIMKELEKKVYGSYAIVDKVYLYRSPVSRQTRRVSWLWHYDNHPREILKVMIYLSNVDNQSAPFEYLRHAKSLKPVYGSPLAPLCGDSRINEERMLRYLARGFESHQVTGPSGTLILFDNNVIHRGNLACQTHRDVLVLQVRPTTIKSERYVDPRWTGSFQHGDFNPNPADHKPYPQGLS